MHIYIYRLSVTMPRHIYTAWGIRKPNNHVAHTATDKHLFCGTGLKAATVVFLLLYVSGVAHIATDKESRLSHDNSEYRVLLDIGIFPYLTLAWDTPTLDMFASRLNSQIDSYM